MATLVDYVRVARDGFAERPLCRVDSLCLSWLAYLRYPTELAADTFDGVPIAALDAHDVRSKLVALVHDSSTTAELLAAMARSPRFGEVRAFLHVAESSEVEGKQFAATSFRLPDGLGTYVAYRGTDDTLLGWKENLRLACTTAAPSQLRATTYLDQLAFLVEGPLWVGGHSKGGNLAEYACRTAPDEVRARIVRGFSHDGPGFRAELTAQRGWHDDVPIDKTVPRESLVGLLLERSQRRMCVVRSSAEGIMQHAALSWEVSGGDFALEQGLSYDSWRLAQRLNDWVEDMDEHECVACADMLGRLLDATGETSFSALLRRWSAGGAVLSEALQGTSAADRELFDRMMSDLVATLLMGSEREHGIGAAEGAVPTTEAAARRVEDLTARVNDRFAKLDRLTGGEVSSW